MDSKKVNNINIVTEATTPFNPNTSTTTSGNGNITASILNLPREMIFFIFSFLPLKDFGNVSCLSFVCYQLCKGIKIQENSHFIEYVEEMRNLVEKKEGRWSSYMDGTYASDETDEGEQRWQIRWFNSDDFIKTWNNLKFKHSEFEYLKAKRYLYQQIAPERKIVNGVVHNIIQLGNPHRAEQANIFLRKTYYICWYLLFNLDLNTEKEKLSAIKVMTILLDLFTHVSQFNKPRQIDPYPYTKNVLGHIAYLPENFSIKLELLFTQLVNIHLDMAIQLAHCFTDQKSILWKIIENKLSFPNREIIMQMIRDKPELDYYLPYLQKELVREKESDYDIFISSIDTNENHKKWLYEDYQSSEATKAKIDFFKTLLTNDSGIEQYQGFYESLLFNTNCLALKDIFELLIQKNVNVNVIDNSGNTLLIKAIIEQETEIALLLLQQPKINITLTNKLGKTAKDYLSQLPSNDNKTLMEKSLTELEKKSI